MESKPSTESRGLFGGPIPRDPLEASAKRLGMVGFFAGTILTANAVIDIASTDVTGPPGGGDVPIVLAAALIAFALYGLVRWSSVKPTLLLDIGLGFEVLLASAISTAEAFNQLTPEDPVWGVSWVCVLLVLFPVLVNHAPKKLIVASLVAASTGPASYFLAANIEGFPVTLHNLVEFYTPNYIAFGASVLIIVLLKRLRDELYQAHEMGSYRLLEKIGEGGMGEVWKAQHALLTRPAAIKLIHRSRLARAGDSNASRTMRRFVQEAHATSLLQSSHSIDLYDFGVNREGVFYYVMELLDGVTLQDLVVKFGPQPASRVAHLMIQCCESLADAHARGLIHRDLKPTNIFLCSKGILIDYVKVLDFGLVKSAHVERPITLEGESSLPIGTLEYLAPEAIRGASAVDARADLYSLGSTAYWLLTGRLVFEGDTPLSIAVQHASAQPLRPSEVLGFDVEPAFEEILLLLLRKNPEERVQSAHELWAQLQAIEFDQPWTADIAREWWRNSLPHLAPQESRLGSYGLGGIAGE